MTLSFEISRHHYVYKVSKLQNLSYLLINRQQIIAGRTDTLFKIVLLVDEPSSVLKLN